MDRTSTLILDLGALICCSFFCLEPPMGALIVILFLVLGLSFFVVFGLDLRRGGVRVLKKVFFLEPLGEGKT